MSVLSNADPAKVLKTTLFRYNDMNRGIPLLSAH